MDSKRKSLMDSKRKSLMDSKRKSLMQNNFGQDRENVPLSSETVDHLETVKGVFRDAYVAGKKDALNGLHLKADTVFETYWQSINQD